MEHNPYREIAMSIHHHVKGNVQRQAVMIRPELGAITTSGLKVDGFKNEIRDYYYSDHLDDLASGDRVLVLPINGGKDFVVTARVKRHA